MSTIPGCTGWCTANGRYGGCGMSVCPYYSAQDVPVPTAVSLDPTPTYMRIAAALERIALALERFTGNAAKPGEVQR